MVENAGDDGLIVCKSLSGNSGSFRWSANGLDVLGSGHIDAYVNAWAYRALRNGTAIMKVLKDDKRSMICFDLAEKIKENYARQLLNPETGCVAGWRSRDGMLHDYAFTFINAAAIGYGLLDKKQAKNALNNLEELRSKTGVDIYEYGIPHNLLPISPLDHMLPRIINDLSPTFERYTDGAMSPYSLTLYLRALSINGFKKEASKLSEDYCRGLLSDNFTAGNGVGKEFHSWEGIPIGYEGTCVYSFPPLYSVAVELGIIKPEEPEWWLEG
ncbi:MAG: hypothetical protein Q7J78_06550 [Clostridiales bacterium]|nr:hypothetical protein [Clostridiales bacterium]